MRNEAALLRKVTKWLKQRDIPYIRLAMQRGVTSGWPDLLILPGDGAALFVELKRYGGKLTELQKRRIADLWAWGYRVEWFDDFDECINWIQAANENS